MFVLAMQYGIVLYVKVTCDASLEVESAEVSQKTSDILQQPQQCTLFFTVLSFHILKCFLVRLLTWFWNKASPSVLMSSRELLSHLLLLNFMDNIHVLFHILMDSFISFFFSLYLSAHSYIFNNLPTPMGKCVLEKDFIRALLSSLPDAPQSTHFLPQSCSSRKSVQVRGAVREVKYSSAPVNLSPSDYL